MLREPYYFLHLAQTYKKEIDLLLPLVPPAYEGGLSPTYQVVAIRKQASDLRLKIKLLFQEFDKGQLFYDKCIWVDESYLLTFDDQEKLNQYRHVLSLFIEHLLTFRIPELLSEVSKN
jgi:hypothetical protein